MIHPRRQAFPLDCVAVLLGVACLAIAPWLLRGSRQLHVAGVLCDTGRRVEEIPDGPELLFPAGSAAVLVPGAGGATGSQLGEWARRYRLVGLLGEADTSAARAVIEARAARVQRVVRVGDRIEGEAEVTRVEGDAVTVRGTAGEERIVRDPSGLALASGAVGAIAGAGAVGAGGSLGRFGGRQVNATRWEFRRESLMAYYQELLNQPERLVKAFDSLRPVYAADRRIEGYELHVEGEAEFFDAVGLKAGDVVRAVNSVPMTNRGRAEQFIRRFVHDGLDTFVIEVDRGGQRVKQVYQTR